jgi:hypothetical protein
MEIRRSEIQFMGEWCVCIPSRYAEFESRFARGRTNRVRAR